MAFTVEQIAQGILTTFSRGDYSLAVSRVKIISSPRKQSQVLNQVLKQLTDEEAKIWARYWQRD